MSILGKKSQQFQKKVQNTMDYSYNDDPHYFVDFGDKQLAMTFKPGQIIPGKGDTEPNEAARRSRGKYATAADIAASNQAVRAFIHRALTYIYGPKWHQRTDIYFVVEAIPEFKSKDGFETANLHYHLTFGYLLSDQKRVEMMKNAFQKAANEIEKRLFGRETIFYVAQVRNLQNYRKYILKHQDISRDGFDGILIMSAAKRHSLSNSSRSETAELGNLASAQNLEETRSKAEVATPSALQAPNQEKLVPLEVRGASSEAVSGSPLAMSLGYQKQSEKPATERGIAESLIHTSNKNIANYKQNTLMTHKNSIIKSLDKKRTYFEAYTSKSKGARNKTPDDLELVYIDTETFLPASEFRPSKIGNVTLLMCCLMAGTYWERRKAMNNHESEEVQKMVVWRIRGDATQLLKAYLPRNFPEYLKRRPDDWKETIELAIIYTLKEQNFYWKNRKVVSSQELNDN